MKNLQNESLSESENLNDRTNSSIIPIDRNRKDDLTVEELQEMECFKRYNSQTLNNMLEAAKTYTRIILDLCQKVKQKPTKLNVNINLQQKAA